LVSFTGWSADFGIEHLRNRRSDACALLRSAYGEAQIRKEAGMSTDTATVIGHSRSDKLVLFGLLPLAGAALGFFLPLIAEWATDRRWIPFQGPLELISTWDSWWAVVLCTAGGLVAGVLLAGLALEDTLKVTITNNDIEFRKNQKTMHVLRNQVAVVFIDGREIVVQDPSSRELARERHDQLKSDAKQIPVAFRAHGYPWSEAGEA